MRMIPKACLEDLDVPLPDLATQRLIAEIDALSRRESELLIQLAEKEQGIHEFRPARAGAKRPAPRQWGWAIGRPTASQAGGQVRTDKT